MLVRLRFSLAAAATSRRRNFGVTRMLIEVVRAAVMLLCIEDDDTCSCRVNQGVSPYKTVLQPHELEIFFKYSLPYHLM